MNPMTFDPVTTMRTLNAMARNPFGYRNEEGDGFEPRRYSSRAKWPSALCRPNEGPRSEGQRSHRRTLMVPLATPARPPISSRDPAGSSLPDPRDRFASPASRARRMRLPASELDRAKPIRTNGGSWWDRLIHVEEVRHHRLHDWLASVIRRHRYEAAKKP